MEKKELYFEDDQDILSLEDWKKKGKPRIWLRIYNKDGVTIFEDKAYHAIKLITPKTELFLSL